MSPSGKVHFFSAVTKTVFPVNGKLLFKWLSRDFKSALRRHRFRMNLEAWMGMTFKRSEIEILWSTGGVRNYAWHFKIFGRLTFRRDIRRFGSTAVTIRIICRENVSFRNDNTPFYAELTSPSLSLSLHLPSPLVHCSFVLVRGLVSVFNQATRAPFNPTLDGISTHIKRGE